jgi:hypothetical protein
MGLADTSQWAASLAQQKIFAEAPIKQSDRKNSNMGCSSRLAGTWSLPVVIDAVSCTHGLQQATGKPYESFIFTLEELTRPEDYNLAHANGRPRRGRSDSYQREKYGQDC